MAFLKGLVNVVAPKIENTEEALTQSLASLTWVNRSQRDSAAPQPRPAAPVQAENSRRVESPPPPIPERNPTRPSYTARIQEIEQEHRLELARQIQDNPARSHQQTPGTSQNHPRHRRRATSPTDAEVSDYLRSTRPGLRRREALPQAHRGNPTIQEVAGRRVPRAFDQELHHPQPRRPPPDMAAIRRTSYLDVAAATNQRITPHQIFLKGQVQRQQDATDEWARRTGKPAPPYKFEDFIGKGAYGRVFRA